MNNNCNNHRSQLLRKIQVHSFALVEANLFLDSHPYCKKALEYFKCHKVAYDKYVAEYEAAYGPLTAHVGPDCNEWKWVQGPWPWEREAN